MCGNMSMSCVFASSKSSSSMSHSMSPTKFSPPVSTSISLFFFLSKGAANDLPSRKLQPNSSVRLCTRSLLVKCFVNRSAGLTSPRTLRSSNLLFLMASCTHKVCVSRCLSLPRPERELMPMAALESVHTLTFVESPKSCIRLSCPSAAPAARTTP